MSEDAEVTGRHDLANPVAAAGRLLSLALSRQSLGSPDDPSSHAGLTRRMVQDRSFQGTFEALAGGAGYRIIAVSLQVGVVLGTDADAPNAIRIDDLVDKRIKGKGKGELRILSGAIILATLAAAYPASASGGAEPRGQDFTPADVVEILTRLSETERGQEGVEDVEARLGETVARLVREMPRRLETERQGNRSLLDLVLKCVKWLIERKLVVKVEQIKDSADESLVVYVPQPALGLIVADAGERVFVRHLTEISARLRAENVTGAH